MNIQNNDQLQMSEKINSIGVSEDKYEEKEE